MTLRMYADRKGWPLHEVRVRLTHQREQRDGQRHDTIDRRIRVSGDLDDAQRARLLEIADRCPVHRTLHGPLEVRSTLE